MDFFGFDYFQFTDGFYDNEDFYNYLVTSNYYINTLFTKPVESTGKLASRLNNFIQWKSYREFNCKYFNLDERLKQFFDTKLFCLKDLDDKYSELEIKRMLSNKNQDKSSVRKYIKDTVAQLRIDNIDTGKYLSNLFEENKQEEYKC